MNRAIWQSNGWKILSVILLMLTIGFGLWKSQHEWRIAHDCQCGNAYGRSATDYIGSSVLQNALFIAPAAIGLLVFVPAGLIIGLTIASVGLLIRLQNGTSTNPYFQFQGDAMLVVIVLNLALASISLYVSWKQMKSG